MKISLAAWDTEFFGIKVGSCNLTDANELDQSIFADWDLVYITVDPGNKQVNDLLMSLNIPMVDVKITYLMDLETKIVSQFTSPFVQSYYTSENDASIIDLGIQSGIFSRFNMDPKIEKEKFVLLYTTWMLRSIKREIADEVYVCRNQKGEYMGVITIGQKNYRADIGILAVDEKFRGQQVGKALVGAAIKFSLEKGYRELQVVTQGANEGACKFYEHCGFKEERKINIYHYWKN